MLLENINNYKDICIFGVINIKSLNDKANSVKQYLNQINDLGLTNVISVVTRVNNLDRTLIDYFHCSSQEKVINSYVLLSDISDHFPLYIKLKHSKVKKNSLKNENQYFQQFSKINTNKLLTDASHILNKTETNKITNCKSQLIQI